MSVSRVSVCCVSFCFVAGPFSLSASLSSLVPRPPSLPPPPPSRSLWPLSQTRLRAGQGRARGRNKGQASQRGRDAKRRWGAQWKGRVLRRGHRDIVRRVPFGRAMHHASALPLVESRFGSCCACPCPLASVPCLSAVLCAALCVRPLSTIRWRCGCRRRSSCPRCFARSLLPLPLCVDHGDCAGGRGTTRGAGNHKRSERHRGTRSRDSTATQPAGSPRRLRSVHARAHAAHTTRHRSPLEDGDMTGIAGSLEQRPLSPAGRP